MKYGKCILTAMAACFATSAALAHPDDGPKNYGEGDTIGAANNLSQEGVIAASKLVKEGKTYPLGVIVDRNTPVYPGRSFDIKVFSGPAVGSNKLTGHDDRLETHVGIGSQIDGLAHIGINGVHYNGIKAEEIFDAKGLKKLGTEHIPPIVTRGVMIDMTKHFGVEQLAPLQGFGAADIKSAAKAQGITIRKGDVVLFHTGWLKKAQSDPKLFIEKQPGINVDGAKYLAERGVVAVGADSAALETLDFKNGALFPVHALLLAKYGVYVLETINTAELAKDGASEFLFVLGQPRYAGSVQAAINPIAIR